MLDDLVRSFTLGFAISAVPGAVLLETIRRTLTDRSTVLSFMIGNFGGIMTVIVAVFFGVSAVLSQPGTENIFYASSGLLLLYLGVSSIISKPNGENSTNKLTSRGKLQAVISGFILATANPLSILFWISLIGTFVTESQSNYLAFVQSLFVVLGVALLFVVVIIATIAAGSGLKPQAIKNMSQIFGLVLAVFGLSLIARIFS